MDIDVADIATLLQIRDGIYADDLVVAAIVRLDLLTVIADDPGTIEELCVHHDIAYRSADVLCTLLRAMGLLEPGEILRPTRLARSCLVRGATHDIRPYLASAASRSTCIALAEVLRTGRPAPSGAWSREPASRGPASCGPASCGPASRGPASRGPASRGPANGECLTAAPEVPPSVFAAALADQLADLQARSVLEIQGAGESLPPRRHDLHLLPHLLHRRNAVHVRELLARSFDALLPGGWIVDHDVHLNADKSGPLSVARYSALLLHTTEGQCWSVSEMAQFLGDTGFINIEERHTAADRTAILAQKPAPGSGPSG